jgi:hypothetical protein
MAVLTFMFFWNMLGALLFLPAFALLLRRESGLEATRLLFQSGSASRS